MLEKSITIELELLFLQAFCLLGAVYAAFLFAAAASEEENAEAENAAEDVQLNNNNNKKLNNHNKKWPKFNMYISQSSKINHIFNQHSNNLNNKNKKQIVKKIKMS